LQASGPAWSNWSTWQTGKLGFDKVPQVGDGVDRGQQLNAQVVLVSADVELTMVNIASALTSRRQ
jgi:hypothetical protein